ncbi:site-specific integrase [Flexithrix dorotheae]|uniref:site-specific integrase n=1 Tax=Flexithrix dorotheae TaxID=70993 RepID=UPI000399D9E4|nr:site-specific integrase [Flexithrix dorotheae]
MKIRFKLRETSLNNFYLYCLVRVNKKPAKSAIATGIRLEKKDWDSKKQTITNDSLETEIMALNHFRNELRDTYRFLLNRNVPELLSGELLKKAFVLNEKPSITLLQAYESFFNRLEDLRKRKKIILTDLSLRTYKNRRNYVRKFLLEFHDLDYKLSLVNEPFLDSIYDYGFHIKGDKHNHLMKVLQFLKRILAYSKIKGWIPINPVELYPIRYEKGNTENYLFEHELEKIKNFPLSSEVLIKTRDLFIAQCWSGFAYNEFQSFNYEKDTFLYNKRRFISKDRQKTRENSLLPVFPEFDRILKKYNYNIPVYSNQAYNRYLKELGAIVGIDLKLTTHVARKTAGHIWLNKGVKMEAVSKMLGHKSIRTTEQLYAKVHPELVFRETKHLIL